MPTPTYTPLATVTLGTTAASVTFSSIPATYRDLILVSNIINSGSAVVVDYRLNGDTGSNYNYVRMYGPTGSDSASSSAASLGGFTIGTNSAIPSSLITSFMDYSATDKHKTFLTRINDLGFSPGYVGAISSRWANTAAVTSLTIVSSLNTYAAGSTFNLYGVIA
jgi:hypothetical protein